MSFASSLTASIGQPKHWLLNYLTCSSETILKLPLAFSPLQPPALYSLVGGGGDCLQASR